MNQRPGEYIDDPTVDASGLRANLRDQAAINRLFGWNRRAIRLAFHGRPDAWGGTAARPLRVLDAACGGADLARDVVERCRQAGVDVHVTALDRNPVVLDAARDGTKTHPEIECVPGDILRLPFPDKHFDLVFANHLLHHLAPADVPRGLRELARVTDGRLIAADLRRNRVAARLFDPAGRLLGLHPMSRHDGAVSLRNALTVHDLAHHARAAGLRGWTIWRGRVQMTLVWQRLTAHPRP